MRCFGLLVGHCPEFWAGGEEGGGESNVKQSLAYIQLEKQNERLKEGLIRLLDVTQETDAEQRRRIADTEKDVQALDELHYRLSSSPHTSSLRTPTLRSRN